ncbi:MAG: tetratricopeptide repeat protein [Catenulispora sp.]
MTALPAGHLWAVSAASRRPGDAAGPGPGPDVEIACHRRLRGPYTAAGAMLRRAVPDLLEHHADVVLARAVMIVAIAPELAADLPLPEKTLTDAAGPTERTRFYAAGRTQRMAHGVAEIMREWARRIHPGGVTVALTDFDHADVSDRELVRVMLRRCDPAELRLVVELDDPQDDLLEQALTDYAARGPRRPRSRPEHPAGADLAQLYIDSDCTDDDPALVRAYEALPAAERARRHTARAEVLTAQGEPSLLLGAIAYHHEHGVDPAGAGRDALLEATTSSLELGYYHASMDLAMRGRAVVSREEQEFMYLQFTTKVAACLSYLGPAEEAAKYLAELRESTNAEMHMRSAYMTAMLFTRYLSKADLDHKQALEWANISIVIADNHPRTDRRAFNGAFMRNGRALVELHLGSPQRALDLVQEAIGLTDEHLGDGEQALHRSVLLHNRAQVFAAIGQWEAALADFDAVIDRDPNYGEYYFDRAAIRRSAGMYAEALADYDTAIRLNPPFYEAHHNRADLLRELGEDEAALRDLDYALEIEPDHVDSLVNRADLLLALGESERARTDIEHGLTLDPRNARLLSARGDVLTETGDPDQAWSAYSAALEADPELAAAWANRAVLAYLTDRPADAVADLTEALRLTDDARLRCNRAIALQAVGEHRRALEDLEVALASGADDPDVLYRRGVSRLALGDAEGARADWRAHLAACGDEESPYLAEIRAEGGAVFAGSANS